MPDELKPREYKKTLCLDFDGVIHSYTSGWKGAEVIPDPPVPGAFDFIAKATNYFKVAIYSSRSGQPGGIAAMKRWFEREFLGNWSEGEIPHWWNLIEFPTSKPVAFLTIDDRVICFRGVWRDPMALLAFSTWMEDRPAPEVEAFARRLCKELEPGVDPDTLVLAFPPANTPSGLTIVGVTEFLWQTYERAAKNILEGFKNAQPAPAAAISAASSAALAERRAIDTKLGLTPGEAADAAGAALIREIDTILGNTHSPIEIPNKPSG